MDAMALLRPILKKLFLSGQKTGICLWPWEETCHSDLFQRLEHYTLLLPPFRVNLNGPSSYHAKRPPLRKDDSAKGMQWRWEE